MRFSTFLVCSVFLCACGSDSDLRPFSSDGCSLFPDRSLLSESDWCNCCFEHDVAYWLGGSAAEREAADRRLATCVSDMAGDSALADVMYEGVRLGGSPYFPTWYRWGYGWPEDRGYSELTPEETSLAARLLGENIEQARLNACPI